MMSAGSRRRISQLKQRESEFTLPLPFCSFRVPWGGGRTLERTSALLSLLVQTLVSSGNTLTVIPRDVSPAIWASPSPVTLLRQINTTAYLLLPSSRPRLQGFSCPPRTMLGPPQCSHRLCPPHPHRCGVVLPLWVSPG